MTFEQDGGKHTLRHTASHIMAQAIKRLWPEAKLAIGPAIDKSCLRAMTEGQTINREMEK